MRRLLFSIALCLCSSLSVAQETSPRKEQASTLSAEERLLEAKKNTSYFLEKLKDCSTKEEKLALLEREASVLQSISVYPEVLQWYKKASDSKKFALASLVAIQQFDTVFSGFASLPNKQEAIEKCMNGLTSINQFYRSLGGIIGYQDTVLRLFLTRDKAPDPERFVVPPFVDMRHKTSDVWTWCFEGVKRLPQVSQLLVLGGAGDRLNLVDEKSKEPLPAACLLFNGMPLFEGLMRDVQAQEYFYYQVFGKQISVPVVIMTSLAKHNNERIEEMGKNAFWYGHKPSYVQRIIQEQVPMVSLTGEWVMNAPLDIDVRPGGHGVVWKLAKDSGTFSWLRGKGIDTLIVRQVNAPATGLDGSIPTFLGYGLTKKKAFGFASIPSRPGMSEGLNILSIKKDDDVAAAAISNIEYTQFAALKNLRPDLFKEGACPANTNTLFANINAIEKALEKNAFPGTIVNVKATPENLKSANSKKIAARLECSMQNIADELASPINPKDLPNINPDLLSTFLMLQEREKLMSVCKKAFVPGQSPAETPEHCFYDWCKMMRKVLTEHCNFSVPPEQSLEDYLKNGPVFTFYYNPCMGPFWEVIGQKVHNGSIAPRSELILDLAEISCDNLTLDGSLRVTAQEATGPKTKDGQIFSERAGRALFQNVKVINKGFSSRTAEEALKRSKKPEETCEIILEGFSEVVAKDVTISGPIYLFVPNGQRATISSLPSGDIDIVFELIDKPSWAYDVSWTPGSAPRLTKKDL